MSEHWPLRPLRHGGSITVSDDRSTVSRIYWDEHTKCYVSVALALDFDPTDGTTLVQRDSEGRVRRLAPADSDEWFMTAEWDTDTLMKHDTHADALLHAQGLTDRTPA